MELGARALDNRDGDLTSSVTASSAGVDFMNPGEYEVQYRVQDLSGNVGVAVRRVVVVAGPGAEGRAKDGGKGSLDVAALLCLAGVLILRLLGRWNSVAAATGSSSGVFLSRGSSCPSASNSSIIKDASR